MTTTFVALIWISSHMWHICIILSHNLTSISLIWNALHWWHMFTFCIIVSDDYNLHYTGETYGFCCTSDYHMAICFISQIRILSQWLHIWFLLRIILLNDHNLHLTYLDSITLVTNMVSLVRHSITINLMSFFIKSHWWHMVSPIHHVIARLYLPHHWFHIIH